MKNIIIVCASCATSSLLCAYIKKVDTLEATKVNYESLLDIKTKSYLKKYENNI